MTLMRRLQAAWERLVDLIVTIGVHTGICQMGDE